jgi:DnaJ-class molecular chaperone
LDSNALLGVPENAKYREIRAAYRRLAKKYHPDRNNSYSSADLIRKINAAFEVLSDKEKRKQYDETGLDRALINEEQVNEDACNNNMKYYYDYLFSNSKINNNDFQNDK